MRNHRTAWLLVLRVMLERASSPGQHMTFKTRLDKHATVIEELAVQVALLRRRVAALERTCQNDPPGGQGGSTFDPPGPAEGPVPAAETPEKKGRDWLPCTSGGFFVRDDSTEFFPKKISGEE